MIRPTTKISFLPLTAVPVCICVFFFFFKQKTAYEIGLGIPAEPLFRSFVSGFFKIVVIDIQITLKQMLRDFIGIRVNRAKKSGMVNITSKIGRASCRERVWSLEVDVSVIKVIGKIGT